MDIGFSPRAQESAHLDAPHPTPEWRFAVDAFQTACLSTQMKWNLMRFSMVDPSFVTLAFYLTKYKRMRKGSRARSFV
jgi:hypothetical protein